jgi:hypothetical protein
MDTKKKEKKGEMTNHHLSVLPFHKMQFTKLKTIRHNEQLIEVKNYIR